MLKDETLDFVDIVTTMPSHKPLVLLAAAHKVPVERSQAVRAHMA